jgi:hypothetical protein
MTLEGWTPPVSHFPQNLDSNWQCPTRWDRRFLICQHLAAGQINGHSALDVQIVVVGAFA